jgi:hypothetical protein
VPSTPDDRELDMWVETGGFFDGPFEHYEATPDSIEGSAVELDRSYGGVEAMSSNVDATHRTALSSVAGLITGPLATAPEPPRGNARRMMTSAMVAAGSVRVFGHAVQEFNDGVDELNAQWQEAAGSDFGVAPASYPTDASAVQKTRVDEARADAVLDAKISLLTELKLKYDELRAKLDAAAGRSAGQLRGGSSEQAILELFAAGGLPSSVVAAFPHLQFTSRELPPDIAKLDATQVEDFLRAHPEAAVVVNGLLTKDGLSDLEQSVVEAQARIDADVLKQGMSKTGADALEDIAAAQERLTLVNEHVAKTGELNDAAHSYTFAYVNEVGSGNLAKLPDVIRASVGETVTSVHQDVDAMADKYLSPVSDAILNLSNEQLQEESSGEHGPGNVTTYRYDFNGDGVIDTGDMPKAVREIMDMRIGEYQDDTGEVENLDAVEGWADLISSSTVEGGRDFSVDLAEQAIQARQDLNYSISSHRMPDADTGITTDEQFQAYRDMLGRDSAFSDLLSVTARNENASSDVLLNDETREELLGLNWYDEDGAADVIRAGTDRMSEDGDPQRQAEAALAVMQEIGSAPEDYLNRMGEGVEDAVVDVGITYVDTFGEPYLPPGKDSYGTEDGVVMTSQEIRDFLWFTAGAGDQDAGRLQAASINYQTNLLAQAINGGDPDEIHEALLAGGRADGAINNANIEYMVDQEETEDTGRQLAANRKDQAITILKAITGSGAALGGAAAPPAAPFLSVGNTVLGPILDSFSDSPVPEAPQVHAGGVNEDQVTSTYQRNWILLQAADKAGVDVDPRLLDFDTMTESNDNLKAAERIVNNTFTVDDAEGETLAEPEDFDTPRDDVLNGSHDDNDRADSGWARDGSRSEEAMRNLYGRPDLAPHWSADPAWLAEFFSSHDRPGTYGSHGEER